MTATSNPCGRTSKATDTTTTSSDQSNMTSTTGSYDPLAGPYGGMSNSGAETVTATGVHVVFTQPVNQSGVPAQFVEHILGEVFVDSLAQPAPPVSDIGLSSSLSSSCLGGNQSTQGSGLAGGGSSLTAGGSGASGSLSSSASGFGSSSQPVSGTAGNSLPAAFALALKKPLWLLLAYLVWQALVIGTGWSLWNWRRGDAS
jgi:hypothetical protein